MKNLICIFMLLASVQSFADEGTVRERMTGFLQEATDRTIQPNLPYNKYMHFDSYSPAPREIYDQIAIDYRIKSISVSDSSDFYKYFELDKDLVYQIDVEFKMIGNVKKNKFQPLPETQIISYYWGLYQNEWYILDITGSDQMVYTANSYIKWLNAKTPENYTMVIRDIENAVEQEVSAAGNGAEETE